MLICSLLSASFRARGFHLGLPLHLLPSSSVPDFEMGSPCVVQVSRTLLKCIVLFTHIFKCIPDSQGLIANFSKYMLLLDLPVNDN